MNHQKFRRGQRGFIAYILVAVTLLAVVVGFIARSNRGPAGNPDPEKARVNAAAIIQQGAALAMAATRYGEERDINAMTLATTASVGLYDPAISLITQIDAPAEAGNTGADIPFTLDKTSITVTDVGSASAEMAFTLVDLTDAVCVRINRIVNGSSIDAPIPTAVGALPEGCALLSAKNTYYKVFRGV